MAKAAEEDAKFNKAQILTGGILNMTADGFRQYGDSMRQSGVDSEYAREVMMEAAKTGEFFNDDLVKVGRAAAEMGTLTGQSAQKVVQEMVKLRKDPVDAAVELNKHLNFLNESDLQHIITLDREGKQYEAMMETMGLFSKAMDEKMRQAKEATTPLDNAILTLKKHLQELKEELTLLGNKIASSLGFGDLSLSDKIKDARQEVNRLNNELGVQAYMSEDKLVGGQKTLVREKKAELEVAERNLAALEKQAGVEKDIADATAQKTAQDQKAVQAAGKKYDDEKPQKKKRVSHAAENKEKRDELTEAK
ncbi:MAG: phage tail length tape measure family protein [Proteobacteria bacterium]|nr:phage tail length tape measure family protein [Pseudomonadota bacterium]